MRYQEKEIESQLGMGKCLAFDAKLLCPEERIRALCFEDKCDNYSKHYMCPPYIGSLGEIRAMIGGFRRGLLLQYTELMDVKGNQEGVKRSRMNFHGKVLFIEELLKERGIKRLWGMIGGPAAYA